MNRSVITARNTLVLASVVYPLASIYLYRAFYIVVFIGFFLFVFQGGLKPWRRLGKESYPLLCLFLFIFPSITYLWSQYPGETLARSIVVLVQVPIFILAASYVLGSKAKNIHLGFLILTLSFAAVSVFIYLKFGALRADSASMKDFTGAFSNAASAAAVCSLPFFLGGGANRPLKGMRYVAIFVVLAIVLISQSRSALGLFSIAVILSVIALPGSSGNRIVRITAIGVSAVFVGLFVFSSIGANSALNTTLDRLFDSQLLSQSDFLGSILDPDKSSSDYKRTLMYSAGLELIREHWIVGAGYGVLKPVTEEIFGVGSISHSWVITTLGELGAAGFLSMLLIIFLSLTGSISLMRNRRERIDIRYLGGQLFISLCLLYLQGLARPLFPVPLFGALLGITFGVMVLAKFRTARA